MSAHNDHREYFEFMKNILFLLRKVNFTGDISISEISDNIVSSMIRKLDSKDIIKADESSGFSRALDNDFNVLDSLRKMGQSWDTKIPGNDSFALITSGILLKPLELLLDKYGTLSPSEKQLLDVYEEFIKFWTSKNILFKVSTPILNFSTDVQHIEIDNNLVIDNFCDEEKFNYWNKNEFLCEHIYGIPKSQYILSRHKIISSIEVENKTGNIMIDNKLNENIGLLMTAFRLHKTGCIGVKYQIFEAIEPSVMKGSRIVPFNGYDVKFMRVQYFSATISDIDKIKTIYQTLKEISRKNVIKQISVAISRFNQSYERDRNEDKIIDLVIALENCLLPNDENELGYRLSLRGSAILMAEKSTTETQKILKKLYDIRHCCPK